MAVSAQRMRNRWYRVLLQASWARGKDLAEGRRMGWVHRPTADSLWNGELFRRGLQALPRRPEWSYQDDAPSFYDPLDAPRVVLPGLADRYRQTWLGAEARVRSLLPSEILKPDRSYLLDAADWATTVQRSRVLGWSHLRSVTPGYSQRTPKRAAGCGER